MSGVVRPSSISFGNAGRTGRPGGDPLRHGKRVARSFQAGTDPNLLWPGRAQQQILDRLEAGIRAHEGVLLLTGDVGTGKTILAKALLERLRADTLIATVTYAQHNPLDFWKGIRDAWGAGDVAPTLEGLSGRLPALFDDAAARGERLLLFVDEAQALSQGLLTEIGRLAVMAGNPGRSQTPLSILLVGQDELETLVLERPENAALARRVVVRCTTVPLTDAEVRAYVAHQLKITGTEGTGRAPVFSDDGLREMAAVAQGIPRLINTIADLALLSGSQQGRSTIGADIVRQCARQLRQPLGLSEGPRSRRATPPARMRAARRPGRRAALYTPIVILMFAVVGLLFESTRHRVVQDDPWASAAPAAPSPRPPASSGGPGPGPVQPTQTDAVGVTAAPDPEPPPEVPVRPTALHPPERSPGPAPAVPPAPAPTVRRPAVTVPRTTEPRRESSAAGIAPAAPPTPEVVPPPPTSPARGPRPATAETVDPGGIIDWLLSEYPARRQ